MNAVEQGASETDEKDWDLSFSAVELGGSAALGADIRLDLAPRATVLVGRNGAGKSLLLEKLHDGIWAVMAVADGSALDPARIACDVDVRPRGHETPVLRMRHECRWQPRPMAAPELVAVAREVGADVSARVEETCRLVDPSGDLFLWRVDDGVLTYKTGQQAQIAAGRTLLNWTISRGKSFVIPNMAYPLRELFFGVSRVSAGIPRGDGEREELSLPYPEPPRLRASQDGRRRLRRLAYNLVDWHQRDPDRFEEIVELGRRTGLFHDITVKIYLDPEAGAGARRRDLVSVLVDDTDLGLLSDGTLRVTEIFMWLLLPGLKLLLIEEPETAVHPGLLSKLLAEVDAYSKDRQVLLSTQSPQVVSWADPGAVRLVERRERRTEVRGLRPDEQARLHAYLHDEGTLGDFIYSGALDG